MTLDPTRFAEFFAAVNGGATPFRWQERLLDHLLTAGHWPDQISAPTGAGKSAVIDVHVFSTALSAVGIGPRLPRRLVVVVNRRALVDAQFVRAERIRGALAETSNNGIIGDVADALRSLQTGHAWVVEPRDDRLTPEDPPVLRVTNLRGGVAPTRGWIDDITSCQVIAATPDMFGSRLLFRGYGTTPQARPREAGLLAFDTVVVVDEAHLSRQLLMTARRIVDLEGFAARAVGVPVLHVVETTATPAADADADTVVGVQAADLATDVDPVLRERLTRPKPVTYIESPAWPSKGKAMKAHVDLLVTTADASCNGADGVIGCIVNRVDTAVRVADGLRARGRNVAVWVGPRRPDDIADLRKRYPQLEVGGQGGDALDVLVATQTIEVGVDLDLARLVTELASASALAQRAGRVNRVGARPSAEITVVGPKGEATADLMPYAQADLVAARRWLAGFVDTEAGMSPWALRTTPAPQETPRRTLFQRLEIYDAWRLARTSERLFTADDLTLWLSDDVSAAQLTAGVVVRPLPGSFSPDERRRDVNLTVGLLKATPPTVRETFPGAVYVVQAIADRVRDEVPDACLFRDGEVIPLADNKIRGGDVLMVPDTLTCTVEGVLTEESDATEHVEATWGDPERRVVFAGDPLCEQFAGLSAEEAQRTYAESHPGDGRQVVVPVGVDGTGVLPWVVLRPRRSQLDPDTMQESALSGKVSLDQHHANVAGRAERIASAVGLGEDLVEAVVGAAELHDEGKRDPRFQRRLRADPGEPVLAKSGLASGQQARRDAKASGLRTGWRHEQLSAAVTVGRGLELAETDLTVRLVGTSHGYGRVEFDPPPSDLLSQELDARTVDAVHRLYGPTAEWHDIVENTERRWGVWGCAFLEAVLRAADCQVSREGS